MYRSDETLFNNAFVRKLYAERLKDRFPESHVLFTIRNQLASFESYYESHGRILKPTPKPYSGRFISLEDCVPDVWKFRETSYLSVMDYWKNVSLYSDVFSAHKVHVLIY